MEQKHPLPPFTLETAKQKIQMAEDAWNSQNPEKVSFGYFGSICASDFGFIVPGFSVQTVPFLPVH